MAAHAALVSLMNNIDQIRINPRLSTSFNKNHLESLGKTVGLLLNFVESYDGGGRSREVADLEAKFAAAASTAEDAIESYMVDLNLAGSAKKSSGSLQKMMKFIRKKPEKRHLLSVIRDLQKVAEDARKVEKQGRFSGLLQKMVRCTREKLHLPSVIGVLRKVTEDGRKVEMQGRFKHQKNGGLLQKMMRRMRKKLHLPSVICDLERVTEDMDSIKKDVAEVEKQGSFKHQTPHAASSGPVSAGKNSMVRFDDYMIHLIDEMTGRQSHQLVIPVTGIMSGIGKTTLAGFLVADSTAYSERSSPHTPKKISLLWNCPMVKINEFRQIIAPSEIWEMVQLSHLHVAHLYVPDPSQNGRVGLVLQNLQTLWRPVNFRLTKEVCRRISNVKKLGLEYNESELPWRCDTASYYCPQNIGRFCNLESLSLVFEYTNWRPMVLNMTFPSSIKKLSLRGGHLYWEDLKMIGSLPNLEALKLLAFSMIGSEWNPVKGEFPRLRFLQIFCCPELVKWNADHFHFPALEKLDLGLSFLDEIPSGIGEISTLRNIRLFNCIPSCALSAVKILEEQESLGNDNLQVEVEFYIDNHTDQDRFRQMMEEEDFTSKNLHIKSVTGLLVEDDCFNSTRFIKI